MTAEQFRSMGHELIDYIADYRDKVGELAVRSQVEPGWVAAQLNPIPPEHGDGLAGLTEDLDRVIVPGLTHWQSPSFFAYFPANASLPSVLGDLVSSGFGVQGMLWATSPAATELETVLMDWLVDLCDLPGEFLSTGAGGGVIQDSASSGALTALVAARHRLVGHRPAPELVAYASGHAHSSLVKGMRVAGFADDQLRTIPTDENFAMLPNALAAAMADDVEAGRVPFFVFATTGTTSSAAMDPVAEIAGVIGAGGHDAWLHVDGAYGGAAAVAPELRAINAGLERADSYTFNAHKWLLTNFDASAFWVRDRAALMQAMEIVPEYLKNAASDAGAVIDYRDWHVPLGRRFRALKLWLVIRWYGAEGLRAHVRSGVALAAGLADRVRADGRFELVAPPSLGLVCFAHIEGDDRTQAILEAVNRANRHYITHTVLDGRYTIRVAVGSIGTAQTHMDSLWAELDGLA